jgi:hypothetical protein
LQDKKEKKKNIYIQKRTHIYVIYTYSVQRMKENARLNLQDVDLQTRVRLLLIQNGAPPHDLRVVRELLKNALLEQQIGRGGPTAWHTLSPHLNPSDVYLRRNLKTTSIFKLYIPLC